MKRLIKYGLPVVAALAFTAIFITPYCGFLFHCGCKQLWAGALRYCNIHHLVAPRCPFCSHGTVGFYWYAAGPIIAAQLGALLFSIRRRISVIWCLLLSVATFLTAGAVVAWIFVMHDHYHF